MLADSWDKEIKCEPVCDSEGDQGPSDGWRGEPRGGFSCAGGCAAGGGDPGGDDGEDVCDGEEEGGCEADVGVHEGFLAPISALGKSEEDEA